MLIPGPVVSSLVDSSEVDSTRSVHPADGSSQVHSTQVDSSHSAKKTVVLDAFEELAILLCHNTRTYLLRAHIHIRGRRLPGRGHNYRSALFPPASWNKRESVTEGIALLQIFVISISCEGWHNSLQSLLLCNHPSMRTLSDGIMKRLQCKLPVSFGQLVEVNEHWRKSIVSSKNVSKVQLTTMDKQIVWHSCVLWLTSRGAKW